MTARNTNDPRAQMMRSRPVDGLFFRLKTMEIMLTRERMYGMNPKKSQVSMPCWRCVNLDMAGQAIHPGGGANHDDQRGA